jgi:hypothetical protein
MDSMKSLLLGCFIIVPSILYGQRYFTESDKIALTSNLANQLTVKNNQDIPVSTLLKETGDAKKSSAPDFAKPGFSAADSDYYDISVHNMDTSKLKSSKFVKWYTLNVQSMGLGLGSSILQMSYSLVDFTIGSGILGGFGIGTSLFDSYFTSAAIFRSFFPIYLHYPIYISKNKTKPSGFANSYNITSMVDLYAGGSLWSSKTSLLGLNNYTPDRYFRIGVKYVFRNWVDYSDVWGNMHGSVNAGLFFYPDLSNRIRTAFGVCLTLDNGFLRIKY